MIVRVREGDDLCGAANGMNGAAAESDNATNRLLNNGHNKNRL